MGAARRAAERTRAQLRRAAAKAGRDKATMQRRPTLGNEAAPFLAVACDWFWMEVSSCLALWGGERTGLRRVCPAAASGVVDAFGSTELQYLFDIDFFAGLFNEIVRLSPFSLALQDAVEDLNAACHEESDSAVDTKELLLRWLNFAGRFLPKPRPNRRSRQYSLFGEVACAGKALGEDVTDYIRELPSGTLLWMEGRIAISNCFNSQVHLGSNVDGPWILQKVRGRVALQDFLDERSNVFLDEYERFHGRCSLPHVQPEWLLAVHVSPSDSYCNGALAEVLRTDSANRQESMQQVRVPLSMASAITRAEANSEREEAWLLRWVVADADPVPVRLAVVDHSAETHTCVVDNYQLTSHRHALVLPSFIQGV